MMKATNALCEGQLVDHVRFGEGVARHLDGTKLTVAFPSEGERTFLYPDVFTEHLTARGAAFAAVVQADLDEAWQAQADRELALRKRVAAATEAARQQRALEKRAARSNVRSAGAKKAGAGAKKAGAAASL